MKQRIRHALFFSIIFTGICCRKPKSPIPVTPIVTDSVMKGSFENKFIRYTKGQIYSGASVLNWKDTAWQGDRVHKQIVLWSDKEFTNITYETSNLQNGSNSISSSNIRLRFAKYVLGDVTPGSCNSQSVRTNTQIADALSTQPVTSLSPYDPVKIWITVDVPTGIAAGIYTCTISVKANGIEKLKFNIQLLVVSKVLPTVANWSFHLDLWQFPFQLSTLHNNENADKIIPFSDRYFSLIEPFYKMLADAGQKTITTYIKDGAFVQGQTMVKWTKRSDGTWAYDFTNFDLYVEKMMSWGITKQINCFSLVGWQNNTIGYYDEASASALTLNVPPGSAAFATVWDNFLTAFKVHLDAKGWFNKSVLYMDEISETLMTSVISVIKNNNSNWKIGLAGSHASNTTENNLYDYSTILGYNRFTSFANNRVNTFYTSCTQVAPNSYVATQTSPAEMPWLGWYAVKAGYNGFLRWAYDYWTRQEPSNIQDGNNTAGDFSIIYRTDNSGTAQPVSSIRLELLREGIQDYEKIKLLANPSLNTVIDRFTVESGKNALPLVMEAQSLLKRISAN